MSWVPRVGTSATFHAGSGKKTAENPLFAELNAVGGATSKSSALAGGVAASHQDPYASKSDFANASATAASLSEDSSTTAAAQQLQCDAPIPVRERNHDALNRSEVKKHVLATYTSNVPIVSLVTEEGEQLTDEQRFQMKISQIDTDSAAKANQSDLIRHIEGLDAELKGFWGNGEKVRALRIAIQATKLLNNPRAPHCYPSIFILVASVLDTFGNFVADRLQSTAAGKSFVIASLLKRGQEAAADIIPPEAVELCSNWFLKIASIRELLPRICIELSLIKCYKFVAKKVRVNMTATVERLARQIRGVADPLVGNHLRWYLFMRAAEVLRHEHWGSTLEQCAIDAFTVVEQLRGPVYEASLRERAIKHEEYLGLFSPALQWMLDTVIRHGNPATRPEFLRQVFELGCKSFRSAALLFPLLRAIPATDLIALTPPSELLDEISATVPVYSLGLSRVKLVETFALALAEISDTSKLPMSRKQRSDLLQQMWEHVEAMALGTVPPAASGGGVSSEGSNSSSLKAFLSSCGALLQFAATHMGLKQVNLLLGAARKQLEVSSEDCNDDVLSLLGGIVTRLDISSLLTSNHFIPLVKYLRAASRRQLAVAILDLVPRDPAYGAATLELSKILHGVLPSDSETSGELERCARAICNALRRVFSTDPEAELRLLSDARHSLTAIDAVKALVVAEAVKLVHSCGAGGKKRQVAKGCLAFCHVTVPAVMRPLPRVRAALLPAAVAFQYGYIAQGEALLHLCMQTLREVPATFTDAAGTLISNDLEIIETVLQLVSIAAVIPPHAKYGHAYVARALLAWNHNFGWLPSSVGKVTIYSAILRAMSRAATGELAYAFPRCGTQNYRNDPAFVSACTEIATEAATCGVEVLEDMLVEHQADSAKYPRIAQMAVELFETCCYFGDVDGDDERGAATVLNAARLTFQIMSSCVDGTDIPFVRRARNIAESSKLLLGPETFGRLAKAPKKAKREPKVLSADPLDDVYDDLEPVGGGSGGGAFRVEKEHEHKHVGSAAPGAPAADASGGGGGDDDADALLDELEGGGSGGGGGGGAAVVDGDGGELAAEEVGGVDLEEI